MAKINIHILLHIPSGEALLGNELSLYSLAQGFDLNQIQVTLHASTSTDLDLYRAVFNRAASLKPKVGQIHSSHHEYLRYILKSSVEPLLFLDPDVLFFEKLKLGATGFKIVGRKVPGFYDSYTGCYTHARIHTSFLYSESPAELQRALEDIEEQYIDFDAFRPVMVPNEGGAMERFDTLSTLYNSNPGLFLGLDEYNSSAFEHLFCGTHLDTIYARDPDLHNILQENYKIALDPDRRHELRGLWNKQLAYFEKRRG